MAVYRGRNSRGKKQGRRKMAKVKKSEDWLTALFKKGNFDENLAKHPLRTFKKTYDDIVVIAFHGTETKITRFCIELRLKDAAQFPSERSLLMLIDKEGIVHWKD
jgi:hypothetical protein